MKLTATQFRKELFPVLERALHGEAVEVTYKGSAVKLFPAQGASKLDRMKTGATLVFGCRKHQCAIGLSLPNPIPS